MAKKNEVAVVSPVVDALSVIKTELSKLKEITESAYKTDGKIEGYSNTIENETDPMMLYKMYAAVLDRKRMYDTALLDLGIETAPVFKINGNSIESIKHDILLKLAVIQHDARKKELEALVKEAEGFMTKEDQFRLFQEKLTKVVGGK